MLVSARLPGTPAIVASTVRVTGLTRVSVLSPTLATTPASPHTTAYGCRPVVIFPTTLPGAKKQRLKAISVEVVFSGSCAKPIALGPSIDGQPPREVPSGAYFDLATWHLINTLYRPARIHELRAMKVNYADVRQHTRLMKVLADHLGHDLVGRAEQAKIEVAAGGTTRIDLGLIERGLSVELNAAQAIDALRDDIGRIAQAALETVTMAGLAPERIDALYFTGGSTGLLPLTDALAAAFPGARAVHGERLASVATGLGLHARRVFG